ncbi:HAD family hydrolase [archaeon]|nr:HAD family hydrolase [archaeon]
MPCITVRGERIETDLVIFDKDGTLLDFQATWVGIIRELVSCLRQETGLGDSLTKGIEQALGISLDRAEIDGNGALAMGTFTECNALLTYSLYREGLRWDNAQIIVESTGKKVFGVEIRKKHVKAARGALSLLMELKSRGISTAVATNDKYSDALIDMECIGASSLIDLVAGADSVKRSKPAPDMIDYLCTRLEKDPQRSVLIGDTVMDAMLGKNAGVSLTIGVAGIVAEKDLAGHMNVVISSLDEIK